ncbi:MAG: glycosyltransferase family 39 protein [Verrucomicrobiaceae bacterium]|nr:glycosyltransferase family 39 protein [Verrucomicrobiaceae bacterium]
MLKDTQDALWTRRFCWLVLGVLGFRLLYLAAAVDFELAGDEAYYWDWGRQPDWCYFSKPPLIGWIMGALRVCFGYHWWVVKAAAAFFAAGTSTMMFLLGRQLYDSRTGFFGALLMLVTPAFTLLSFALTIDAPLLLCWSAALLFAWRAISSPNFGRWSTLVLVTGIGVLAKQMMLVFPVLLLGYLAISRQHRPLLKSIGPWSSTLAILAFMTPVVWWNQQHGWATLKHTAEHFEGAHEGAPGVMGLLEFIGKQAGMYAIIAWGAAIAALVVTLKNWKNASSADRFLCVFSLPGLVVVAIMAMRQPVNENWPGVYYISAFVLAVSVLPRLLKSALWTGAALSVAVHVLLPLLNPLGLTGSKFDFLKDMRGFSAAGNEIGAMLSAVPRPEQTFVYVLGHRYNASQLAFHLPQHPRVYRWNASTIPESQYEIWPGAQDKVGWDAVIIQPQEGNTADPDREVPYLVEWNFTKVERIGSVEIPIGKQANRVFNVFLGHTMIRWPEPEAIQLQKHPRLQQLYLRKGRQMPTS